VARGAGKLRGCDPPRGPVERAFVPAPLLAPLCLPDRHLRQLGCGRLPRRLPPARPRRSRRELHGPPERRGPVSRRGAPAAEGHRARVARLQAEQGQRAAELAKAQLAAIVASWEGGIVGKTLDGIVTGWNQGAERLFGYAAEEMIGQPISRIMPPSRRGDFERVLDAIRRGERVEHFETERLTKDGRIVDVSISVSPIRDHRGRIVGAAKIARDMTDRKRVGQERADALKLAESARAEAEAANRAKDEVLAMPGHELRTPLSAVRNAIVSAQLDGAQRERALLIGRRQAEQLGRLVDDLLDVARITKGRISLRKAPVYVADVIERGLEATRTLIEDHGHALTVSLPPDDLRVEGDLPRLEQILVNVLNNAAKYTPPGG